MFLKLCAAYLVLPSPVTGIESVSVSFKGVTENTHRAVIRTVKPETSSHNGMITKTQRPVVRKVVRPVGGLAEYEASDQTTLDGVAVALHVLEKRMDLLEDQNITKADHVAHFARTPQAYDPVPSPSPHISLQQVMTCSQHTAVEKTIYMSCDQYESIVDEIRAIMTEFGNTVTNNHSKLADFAGCTLRAAGHDFMDFRDNAGGSDGCLRFEDPDNKGLINCLNGNSTVVTDADTDSFNKSLHSVYQNHCGVVSLADFIVIAGEAVMGFTEVSATVDLKEDFKASFRYGRTTSATCANNVALPNPANGCADNEQTFLASNALHLSWRETAALMGVHTIGKASPENSGFSGWWQDEQNVARFNNNYYISIVNHGWGPEDSVGGKKQWGRIDFRHDDPNSLHPEMMLNTDMCLVYTNVTAELSNCCAWERLGDLQHMNITETYENKSIFCGSTDNPADFAAEQLMCCGPPDLYGVSMGACAHEGSATSYVTGGASLVPQGPATDAVHAFAGNEDLWLGEFKAVWKLATEKGAGTLTALQCECQVTVYEHWPEGIPSGLSDLAAAEQAWGGRFPTGAKKVLTGIGNHSLGTLSNLTSSVKIQGDCCKAYAYTTADCSGAPADHPIESEVQYLNGLPLGVVTPATGLASVWGCNDCAQCVKVTQQCTR